MAPFSNLLKKKKSQQDKILPALEQLWKDVKIMLLSAWAFVVIPQNKISWETIFLHSVAGDMLTSDDLSGSGMCHLIHLFAKISQHSLEVNFST